MSSERSGRRILFVSPSDDSDDKGAQAVAIGFKRRVLGNSGFQRGVL